MTRILRKISALPIAAAMIIVCGGNALAAPSSNTPTTTKSQDGGSVTTTRLSGGGTLVGYSGPQGQDKQQWISANAGGPTSSDPTASALAVTPQSVPFNCPWCHGYHTFSPNASVKYSQLSGNVQAYGQSSGESSQNVAGVEYVDFTNSSITGCWLGTVPFYADGIAPSAKWWVSGVAISVSIPAGVGFSQSGSGVAWNPGTVPHSSPYYCASANWQQDIKFSAAVINNAYFTAAADIAISGQWYHVSGTGTW